MSTKLELPKHFQVRDNKILTIDLLKENEVSQLLELQDTVLHALDEKRQFQPDDEQFIQECLGSHGRIFGAYVDGQLVGYQSIRIPKDRQEHLALDYNFPDSELPHCIHMETCTVLPHCRGMGIARKLKRIAWDCAQSMGFKHMWGNLFPENLTNIKIQFELGFFVFGYKVKYGNKPRYLINCALAQTLDWQDQGIYQVPYNDVDRVLEVIDKGYLANQMIKEADQWYFSFARLNSNLY